jgi:exopolysaccharide biosynthesis operon protein EpsL
MTSVICTILAAALVIAAAFEPRTVAALAAVDPGSWAAVVGGLIAACVIARRRSAALTYRDLALTRLPLPQRAGRLPTPRQRVGSTARARRRRARQCVAAVVVLLAAPARALDQGTLVPFVEERITTDDNVFRISSELNPIQTIGSASTGDTYRSTAAGLTVDLPLSRQRLTASLRFDQTRYNRFSDLDFNGRDLRGSWHWQAGDKLGGELGASDTYSLGSFAEVRGTTPDRLQVRQEFARVSYMLTPFWRLRAAADRIDQYNSDPALQFNDVRVDAAEASLAFVSRAGNSIGLRTRVENGQFPYLQQVGTALIDNAYRQSNSGLTLDWTISPASHLVARADQVSRDYEQLPQRDFHGPVGRVDFVWTPPFNLSLTAFAQRDISPYELIRSSMVLVRGLGLLPSWKVTPRLEATADLEWANRRYLGDPAQALGLTSVRDDRVRTLSGTLSYHAASWAIVQASLLHEQRSSNIEFGDYTVRVFWLSARFTF